MVLKSSPMPPPLLPLLTRLGTQLTVLTQPRHLDNISRRLKLLLSDLDRLSSGKDQHRRQQSQHGEGGVAPGAPSTVQEQLSPILTRLVPALPQIPHILARLRTLAVLHASAAEFQSTLGGLEEDQRRLRETLGDLERAVGTVEASLKENGDVVKTNVTGLEERIQALSDRLDNL
jgi:nuclear migration protein JNM1